VRERNRESQSEGENEREKLKEKEIARKMEGGFQNMKIKIIKDWSGQIFGPRLSSQHLCPIPTPSTQHGQHHK
jgi:hypothetical protein